MPAGRPGQPPGGALVLVGAGAPAELAALLPAAAAVLAAEFALPVQPLAGQPAEALAALQGQGPALAWLECDPGRWLAGGGTWAEALGAWRQPTLALIAAPQLAAGQAAALVALLRQERVPLLGLLQWQGPWQPQQRRADGLPWLGVWEDEATRSGEGVEAWAAVAPLLLRRWLQGLAQA